MRRRRDSQDADDEALPDPNAPSTGHRPSTASMAAMPSSQSALDSLRTVEFRETLKGYHRDDVDEYLEKAAIEAEGLQEQLRQSTERLRKAAETIAQLETELAAKPEVQPEPVVVA